MLSRIWCLRRERALARTYTGLEELKSLGEGTARLDPSLRAKSGRYKVLP